MFTGIVQEIGTVADVERSRGIVRLSVHAPSIASRVSRLESVAVNGACVSVVGVRQGVFHFELIPETQRLTNLGRLRRGDRVNLEPSLTLADRLNGHIVLGHIDTLGTIARRRQLRGELILEIRLAPAYGRWVVSKGPVTVDGVSVTVGNRVTRTSFSVHLIPETLRQTTLAQRCLGDDVNIELDYVAKIVSRFLEAVCDRLIRSREIG